LKNCNKILLILIILIFSNSQSQQTDAVNKFPRDLSVSVSGNYISSASIQLYEGSENFLEGNFLTELEGGYSLGLNIRKRIYEDNLFLSLSTEYISIKDDNLYQVLQSDTNFFKLNVEEELTVFPLELSIYYLLPDFFRNTRIYIGGGIGTYFGDRKRQLGPYVSETTSRAINFTMNVLFCAEYSLGNNLAANFEIRFRDAQYRVRSRYPENSITIDGINYVFPQEFNSRIFIDGLKIGLGITYFIF
jgi:opacity protein-like surface antigen